MKKIFTIFAAMLLASIAFAQSYTLNLVENTADLTKDNGNIYAKSVEAIFGATEYVSQIDVRDNIYPARQNCGGKFGTSSKKGILAFTLATPTEVDSIVVMAAKYGDSEGADGFNLINVLLEDTARFTLSAGNKVMEPCVWKPTGLVTTMRIAQYTAANQRFYVKSITVYPKSNTPTAIEAESMAATSTKVVRNGQVLILRDGKTYNALGKEIK